MNNYFIVEKHARNGHDHATDVTSGDLIPE